jgi:putative SOS response-associated peptidase YedK
MCYSALLIKAYEEYERMFSAPFDLPAFHRLYRQRELDLLLKIPPALDSLLAAVDPLNAAILRESDRLWRANCEAEIVRLKQHNIELTASLPKKANAAMKAPLNEAKRRCKSLETALKSSEDSSDTYRIYPKYFAPLIMVEGGERKTVPARYRVLPRSGVEYPDEYNTYNAVREMLTVRKTWKPLFGRQHALFPFLRFYEWLRNPKTGKKEEVAFAPLGYQRMWAASLYEEYDDPQIGVIRSFAMITDYPPPEVAAAGHDRCPIFLQEEYLDSWLRPEGRSVEVLDQLLERKQDAYFENSMVA